MRKIIILAIAFLTFPAITHAQSYPEKKVYNVEYIILDDGSVVLSKAKVTLSNDRITVLRNGETKYWDVNYLGLKTHKDNVANFQYHTFYLTRHKVYFLVSDHKTVKHNNQFYYRIVFDGQTQLAY
jgi:hypothetical protein